MNTMRSLMIPATIAALLLCTGTTCIAPAMADDRDSPDSHEASSARIDEASKEQARQANEAAVREAAEAVAADNRLDLDIRLIGRTSVIIAGEA